MKKLFTLIIAILLVAVFGQPVRAEENISERIPNPNSIELNVESIKSYQTDIELRTDGTFHVSELIEYFFVEPKHGIIRTIPYVKKNTDNKRYKMTLSGISVADAQGNPIQMSQSSEGDRIVLKIGDPDKTITGTHVYDISYDVAGGMTYFPGHDEVYWNAIGTQWEVPIQRSTTTVKVPDTIPQDQVQADCFVGAEGATEKSCTSDIKNSVITYASLRPLDPYEGLTVVAAVPKGMIAILEPMELVPFFDTVLGKVAVVILAVIGVLWYIVAPVFVVRHWWIAGRDPKPVIGEARAWFSPPKNKKLRSLTPAETGTLVDETADLRDLYATVVDVARRGYIQIIEVKKNSFDLVKQRDWDKDPDLVPFERQLLDGLFGAKDKVSLKDINAYTTFEKTKEMLYTSLVSDGFFPSNPQSIRVRYVVLAIMAFFTLNPVLLLSAVVFGRHIPRKTLFGSDQASIARSLKKFLVSQDAHLAFQSEKQMMFEKLLPYAIAYGVEVIWAKRLGSVDLTNPQWYVSSTGGRFNSVVFANSIGRGMSVSFAQSVQSSSSRGFSSGFSGGGSSGGGGGGGGGGSW